MSFGQDASFRFTGALPPGSSLLVSNNSFNPTVRNTFSFQWPDSATQVVSAILIGTLSDALLLEADTNMTFADNYVKGILTTPSRLVGIGLLCRSSTLRNRSVVIITGTTILNSSTVGNAYAAYVLVSDSSARASLNLSDQSAIKLIANSILNSSIKGSAFAAFIFVYCPGMAKASLILDSKSLIVMNNNSIRASSVAYGVVAQLYVFSGNLASATVALFNNSCIEINANSMAFCWTEGTTVGVYVAYFFLTGGADSTESTNLALSKNSTVALQGNAIVSSQVGGEAYVAHFKYTGRNAAIRPHALALDSGSGLILSGNYMSNSTVSAAYASCLLINSYSTSVVFLGNSAFIILSCNTMANSTAGVTSVAYVYVKSDNPLGVAMTVSNSSSVNMNNNGIRTCSTGALTVAYLSLTQSGYNTVIMMVNRATLSLSGNYVVNCTAGTSATVAHLFMNGNRAAIALHEESVFNASDNIFRDCRTTNAKGFYMHLSSLSNSPSSFNLHFQSALIVNGNCMTGGSSYDVFAVYLHLFSANSSSQNTLSLSDLSTMVLRGNKFDDYSASGSQGLLYISIQGVGQISIDGTVTLDSNHMSGPVPVPALALRSLLQITTCNLSLGPTSSFNVTSNRLTVPASSTVNSACLLGITQANKVFKLISLAEYSRFVIDSNEVNGASLAIIALSVVTANSSSLQFSGNRVAGRASLLVMLAGGLHLAGLLLVELNVITSPSPTLNYLLVQISGSFINDTSATVQVCGNRLSGKVLITESHLNPKTLTELATPCPAEAVLTLTSTATVSQSNISRIRSHTASVSNSSFHNNLSETIVSSSRSIPVDTQKPLVPVPAAAAAKVKDAASVVVVVTAVASATGGQLGVANAMLRLADCKAADNGDSGSLPILVHPLQFTFGDREYQKNAAAAISNTLIVPLIAAAIALGPVRLAIMRVRSVPSRVAMSQMGWPSLLVLPFANLAEGIGTTAVTAISSGEPFGVGLGLIASALVLTFIGSWVWILARVIPRSRLELRPEEGSGTGFTAGKKRELLMRMVRPTHRWVPLARAEGRPSLGPRFVERYSNAVGDKQWYYAEVLSFACSLAVGVAESLPASICRERVVIALVPALLQCGLAVLALIPAERLLQSLLALCLVPMYIVVVVKVFSDTEDERLDSVMAVFSSAGNVIGIGIMALGLAMGIWEIATTHRVAPRSRHRSNSTKTISTCDLDASMLPTDETDHTDHSRETSFGEPNTQADNFDPQQSPAVRRANSVRMPTGISDSERAVVQTILSQLREYESETHNL